MFDATMMTDLAILIGTVSYSFYLIGLLRKKGNVPGPASVNGGSRGDSLAWSALASIGVTKRSLTIQRIARRA